MLRYALPFFALSILLLDARPVDACSPPLPGFYSTRPESGARIPSNAKLVLIGENVFNPQITVSQLDVAWSVNAPNVDGPYILDVGALGVTGDITVYATADEPNGQSITAQFTVAAEADTTPPSFGGIESISYEFFEEEPGLCQQGGFVVTAVVPPATDDWAPTHYQLYELLPNDGLQHVGTSYHHEADRISLRAYAGREEGTRCYVAFANDIGGNRAPEMTLGGTCVDLRLGGPDAGVIDGGFLDGGTTNPDASTPGDASTRSDAGTKPPQDSGTGTRLQLDDEGGCGCSTTAGTAGGSDLGSLFLLLGPLLARRRRVVRAE